MPENSNNPLSFWQELKRRKVLRVITVYAAVSFVILQLVEILAPSLRLPDWTMNFVMVILIVGFIIAIILSWIYDIHPEGGIVKTEPVDKDEEGQIPKSSNIWKIATFISVVVIISLILFNILGRREKVLDSVILDKSIAVLPFIDDSPEKNNEHIINGILEDLLINLQAISELRVLGRTSIEQYRNNPKPIPEIAKELGVNYIVEGSGQKYGNHYTLRVQLLEGATGMHIWGQKFEQDLVSMEDIVNFISSIARSIATELHAVIAPEEEKIIEKIPTGNLTAYDFYRRGREEYVKYELDNENREALQRAESLYHRALEYDSTFAQAYTGLSWVYHDEHFWQTILNENFLDSMLVLADIALSYDDQLAEAYIIRGDYFRFHNKKEQAIKEYDKAIKINPNDWQAYWNKAGLYNFDDYVQQIYHLQKAASLHRGPLLPRIYGSLGGAYASAGFKDKAIYYKTEVYKLTDDSAGYYGSLGAIYETYGNFEKAIEYYEKSLAIDSTDWNRSLRLGMVYSFVGKNEQYLDYVKKYEERYKTHDETPPNWIFYIGHAYSVNGFREEAKYYLDAGLEYFNELFELDRHPGRDIYIYRSLAAMYAFLGDKDKAFENLRIYNQSQRYPYFEIKDIKNDPMFDSIRDEPEFQQIIQNIEAKVRAEHERVRQWLEENDML